MTGRTFRLLVAGAALVLAAGRAQADEWKLAGKEVREAVKAVVTAQLAALHDRDFDRAYGWASAGIRRQFSAPVFAAMIRRGYPALLRQVRADVSQVRESGEGDASALVTVTDQLDRTTAYRYYLTREPAGWRIEGVVPEKRADRGDT